MLSYKKKEKLNTKEAWNMENGMVILLLVLVGIMVLCLVLLAKLLDSIAKQLDPPAGPLNLPEFNKKFGWAVEIYQQKSYKIVHLIGRLESSLSCSGEFAHEVRQAISYLRWLRRGYNEFDDILEYRDGIYGCLKRINSELKSKGLGTDLHTR
ncbi:MAG: hypothetical protein NTY66_03420 [Candidatus Vogelbacteria bacterium]|nr:hypothetical protein [Candidatus Vogelbacteria bacterium]